jgi:hypothetical protein
MIFYFSKPNGPKPAGGPAGLPSPPTPVKPAASPTPLPNATQCGLPDHTPGTRSPNLTGVRVKLVNPIWLSPIKSEFIAVDFPQPVSILFVEDLSDLQAKMDRSLGPL